MALGFRALDVFIGLIHGQGLVLGGRLGPCAWGLRFWIGARTLASDLGIRVVTGDNCLGLVHGSGLAWFSEVGLAVFTTGSWAFM